MAILVRYKASNYINVSFLLRTTIIDIVLIPNESSKEESFRVEQIDLLSVRHV